MSLKLPVVQVSIYFSNIQTLATQVTMPELKVLKAVHQSVLEASILPLDDVRELSEEEGFGDGEGGLLTVQDEWERLNRHYGMHTEQGRSYAMIAYPDGFEQFHKAVHAASKAATIKPKSAKAKAETEA